METNIEAYDKIYSEDEIKLEEDTLFLKSILPIDENEKRRVIAALFRGILTGKAGM